MNIHSRLYFIFTILALCLPLSSHAIPSGFTDLGNSLVDHSTNLEWLDVNYSNNSYHDTLHDINHDGGLFAALDGWRFATAIEIRQLAANWFDDVDPGPWDAWEAFEISDEPRVSEFVATFTNGSSKTAEGYIDPVSPPGHIGFNGAVFIDGETSFEPGEGYITNDTIILYTSYDLSIPQGAWLVRTVDEPGVLFLLLLPLLAMAYKQKSRQRSCRLLDITHLKL